MRVSKYTLGLLVMVAIPLFASCKTSSKDYGHFDGWLERENDLEVLVDAILNSKNSEEEQTAISSWWQWHLQRWTDRENSLPTIGGSVVFYERSQKQFIPPEECEQYIRSNPGAEIVARVSMYYDTWQKGLYFEHVLVNPENYSYFNNDY